MMDYATKYMCRDCGAFKWLPERPLSPTRRINVGCDRCSAITSHKPVGCL